jgi:L-arabinonolactonase
VSAFTLVRKIPVRNTLGECILWDELAQCAWWTDIQEAKLHRYHFATDSLQVFVCPERLCSFGFIEGDTRLIAAFASGFALFDPPSGGIDWLYRPEQHIAGTRFNDGRVDRQGRFWSGTMVESEGRAADGRPLRGSLYRIAGSEQRRVFGDIRISNSLCFSPDGSTLYFADSPRRQIMAYPIDPGTGEPGDGRVVASVSGKGAPDGSAIDAEGFLWNAQWGGAKIVRYTPAGEIDCELELPVSQPSCVCFGGEEFGLLFVSTARESLSEAVLAEEPDAGRVLVYRSEFRGLAESRYRFRASS